MTKPTRNSTRRREAGEASRKETRRRLLEAAAFEFAQTGYARATVARIADRAGVTVQTLYLAWGSKRALLRAYMEMALAGQQDTPFATESQRLLTETLAVSSDDAAVALRHFAHLFRQIADRAALGWQLCRDAAGSDPAIAEDWQTLQRLRLATIDTVIERLPTDRLRSNLTTAAAARTAWAIASPETYDLIVRTAGLSLDEYESWVADTLTTALLRA